MDAEQIQRPLVEDLADVLVRMVIGWEYEFGFDLAKHPDVVRVMARYREEHLAQPGATRATERPLAEVATVDGELRRLRAGCPAWGPGSGYVHVSEVEMATLTAERDRLQRDRDNLTVMFNDEVRWRNAEGNQAEVLRTQLMQAERVVEALAASLDWVRVDACATCAQGTCSAHQPAAGVIAATKGPDDDG
jgi:hypothetical protein